MLELRVLLIKKGFDLGREKSSEQHLKSLYTWLYNSTWSWRQAYSNMYFSVHSHTQLSLGLEPHPRQVGFTSIPAEVSAKSVFHPVLISAQSQSHYSLLLPSLCFQEGRTNMISRLYYLVLLKQLQSGSNDSFYCCDKMGQCMYLDYTVTGNTQGR